MRSACGYALPSIAARAALRDQGIRKRLESEGVHRRGHCGGCTHGIYDLRAASLFVILYSLVEAARDSVIGVASERD